jgi:hypothetical protein
MMTPFGSELAKLRAEELRTHPAARQARPGRLRRATGRMFIDMGNRLSGGTPVDMVLRRPS